MTGAAGKLTDLEHVASPRQVAVFSRPPGYRGVVTYLPETFFVMRLVASGEKLGALIPLISIILKKYIITSLAGRKARVSATLAGDEISYDGSPIVSPSVTC